MSRDVTESFDPDWTINPGATLREMVADRGWSYRELSLRTGFSIASVHKYLHRGPYPASFAVAFANAVGTDPQFIWYLQCNYQLDLALGRREVGQDD